jgi:Carbohydrate esterase, sialic acid-specific acetylesterase
MGKKLFHIMNRGVTNAIDFFIIAGQSNCGRARVSEMTSGQASTYALTYTDVKMFNYSTNPSAFENLNIGTNTRLLNYNYTDEFGPEASLFQSLKNYGDGGTNLAYRWMPSTGPDWVYFDTLYVQPAVLNAVSNGVKLNLKAFIWMQGEDDATDATNSSNYLTNLTSFFNYFNSYWSAICVSNGFPNVTNCKKVIGRINGINDAAEVYRTTVRTAQANYCAIGGNNAVLIDTDSYPFKDYVHYSATGQISFGIDIYNQVKDL